MPTFDTPEPIAVTLDLGVADIRLVATDRADTVVEVGPSDESVERDRKAAEQTKVDFTSGRLTVKTAKRTTVLFGKPGSVDVVVELPTGSRVHATSGVADLRQSGRLGECRFKTGAGLVQLDHTGQLDVSTGAGSVDVHTVSGRTSVSTGTGKIKIQRIDGPASVKNSNGDCWIGEVTEDARVHTANGDVIVDLAHGSVDAKTACGEVRLREVVRGQIALGTAYGELEIGIHPGTAARLDVHTAFGRVRQDLNPADGPGTTDEKVEVRARTAMGDILIHRA